MPLNHKLNRHFDSEPYEKIFRAPHPAGRIGRAVAQRVLRAADVHAAAHPVQPHPDAKSEIESFAQPRRFASRIACRVPRPACIAGRDAEDCLQDHAGPRLGDRTRGKPLAGGFSRSFARRNTTAEVAPKSDAFTIRFALRHPEAKKAFPFPPDIHRHACNPGSCQGNPFPVCKTTYQARDARRSEHACAGVDARGEKRRSTHSCAKGNPDGNTGLRQAGASRQNAGTHARQTDATGKIHASRQRAACRKSDAQPEAVAGVHRDFESHSAAAGDRRADPGKDGGHRRA